MPTDTEALDQLARVMGVRDARRGSMRSSRFDAPWRAIRSSVRSIHERLYFRPLLEAFARDDRAVSRPMRRSSPARRLRVHRRASARRPRCGSSPAGSTVRRRLMQQMLPLLLDWLSAAPIPTSACSCCATCSQAPSVRRLLVEAFRDSPEVAQRLCLLVGTSRMLGDIVTHNPDLVARLPHESACRPCPATSWSPAGVGAVGGATSTTARRRCAAGRTATCSASRRATSSVDSAVEVVGADLTPAGRGHARDGAGRARPADPVRDHRHGTSRRRRAVLRQRPRRRSSCTTARRRRASKRPTASRQRSCRFVGGAPRPSGSSRSTPTYDPRASKGRWRAASTGTSPTSSATRSPGSARP